MTVNLGCTKDKETLLVDSTNKEKLTAWWAEDTGTAAHYLSIETPGWEYRLDSECIVWTYPAEYLQ